MSEAHLLFYIRSSSCDCIGAWDAAIAETGIFTAGEVDSVYAKVCLTRKRLDLDVRGATK